MPSPSREDFKGLRIAHRIVLATVSIVVVSLSVSVYAYHRQVSAFINESFEQRLESDLNAALDYFRHVYDAPISNDLTFLNTSAQLNDLLIAQGNEVMLVRQPAQATFGRICRTRSPLYAAASFYDHAGNEQIAVTPTRNIKKLVRIANLDRDNPAQSARYELFHRLEDTRPGTVLIEGPFRDGNNGYAFIAGISKIDPDISDFGGAIMLHCDLTPFINYVQDFRELGEPTIWLYSEHHSMLHEKQPKITAYDAMDPELEGRSMILAANCSIGTNSPQLIANMFVWIPDHVYQSAIRTNLIRTAAVLAFAILLSVLLALIVSNQLSKPVIELAAVSREVSEGNLRVRAATRASGEIGLLARSFNEMLETINTHRRNRKKHTFQIMSINRELQLFRDLINQIGDCIYVVDPETALIVDVNGEACRQLGYSREELLGRRLDQIEIMPPDFTWSQYVSNLQTLEHAIGEARYQRKDGSLYLAEKSSKYVHHDGAASIIATARDLTERKAQEEEMNKTSFNLKVAHDELKITQQQVIQQERLRALGQMASGIAHEFNNNLTTILGFSELLLSDPTSLDDRALVLDYLRRIRTVAGDAADVVRRMRSFYRYSHTTELQPIDLNEMIDDVVKLTQPKWKDEALAHGVSVDVIIDSADVPGILGNGAELRELLTNLIFNAVDAITPKAAGVLRLSAEVENDFVVLKVADTGIGMDEETHSQCLEPFFTTKMENGTGLGLSIAYGIVQRHGGSMEIKSTLGEGTTFMLRLPASKFIDKDQPPVAAPALPPKAMTILLVEDQEPVRAAVCHLLERDKHVVIQAATGDEGLNLFNNNDIDLVITDRSMPGLSGDQLAERIKKQSSSTPVILLSGFGDFMKDSGELPEFVDLIVSKPCTLASLREAITLVIKA